MQKMLENYNKSNNQHILFIKFLRITSLTKNKRNAYYELSNVDYSVS